MKDILILIGVVAFFGAVIVAAGGSQALGLPHHDREAAAKAALLP